MRIEKALWFQEFWALCDQRGLLRTCLFEPQNIEQGIMNVEILQIKEKLLTSKFLVRYSIFELMLAERLRWPILGPFLYYRFYRWRLI